MLITRLHAIYAWFHSKIQSDLSLFSLVQGWNTTFLFEELCLMIEQISF